MDILWCYDNYNLNYQDIATIMRMFANNLTRCVIKTTIHSYRVYLSSVNLCNYNLFYLELVCSVCGISNYLSNYYYIMNP